MNDNKALRLIFAAGAAAVVLAAVPYRIFDLDRFFIPKELALHIFALALCLPALRRARALEAGADDLLLALYLALGLAGALFAPDGWLAARAMALTFSGAAVFWAVRSAGAETRRAVAAAAAAAAVLAAATALLQAYGLKSQFFSLHRIPGGTLGNRNFIAHIAAVFAPVLIAAGLGAASRRRTFAAAAGAAVLAAALVLTRSRAALLGLAAGGAVLAFGLWRQRAAAGKENSFRLKALLGAAALGVACALLLPNKLEWKSESPYLDTVAGIADYRKGSGHGRVIQYKRSLRIVGANPVFGAGAGNWGVVYPKFVDGFDHSIDYSTGRTLNPWPSSDWVAVLSERGLPALAALLGLFGLLFAGALRKGEAGGEDALEGYALAGAITAAAVVGCFDAFLLLPAPALLFWGAAGALAAASPVIKTVPLSNGAAGRLAAAAAALFITAAALSASQTAAMAVYTGAHTQAQVARAALLDPGNARIKFRLEAMRSRGHAAPAAQAAQPAPASTTDDTPEQPEQQEQATGAVPAGAPAEPAAQPAAEPQPAGR